MCLHGLYFTIAFPFIFALIVPFLFRSIRRVHTGWFVIPIPVLLFAYFLSYLTTNQASLPVQTSLPWIPSLGINVSIHLDSLALLFALIITGMGSLVVLYSIFYMSREREALGNFYVYLLLFLGAMLGVVISDNLITLYTFWEITSVSSFLLIAYWYQRNKARYGAQKSMMITVFGGFAMLLGFVLLYAMSGTASLSSIRAMSEQLSQQPLFIPAMLLILLGALTKSAQFPFHIWLPDAMEAPTPISAYLHSATMVKAGVYLVARLTPLFGIRPEWSWLIIIVGVTTLFWASFTAIRQHDLKAMLAYSTVSQLGMIMALIGAGSTALNPGVSNDIAVALAVGVLAALFHLVNHSIFKGALFMVIGILDHETGTRDLRRLGGLLGVMPASFIIALIGAFSMAGLPPMSGFISKEMVFTGILNVSKLLDGSWTILLPLSVWVSSIFTFIYCLILVFKPFAGTYRPDSLDKRPHEAPIGMLLAPAALALLVIVFFFYPQGLAKTLLEPAMHAVLPGLLPPGPQSSLEIKAWHGWSTEVFMTMGIIVIGTFLYAYLHKWSTLYDFLPDRVSLNNLYDQTQAAAEQLSARLTRKYMTGLLANYVWYTLLTIVILVGGALIGLNAFSLNIASNSEIGLYELVLGLAVVIAALVVVFTHSRLVAIIALSAVGLTVSLFYVIFRAPDLALTQLVVETISTALFLLCFYFLPRMRTISRKLNPTNAAIALGTGMTLTLLALAAQGYQVFPSIASYFENSFDLAGALNMVNAILVDFRGFDTMLETVVLFTAGIGVYTLIKLRPPGRSDL